MFGGVLQILFAPFGLSSASVISDGVDGVGLVALPRCNDNGVRIHAPSQVAMRISGLYTSTLPDGQVAQVQWDDGLKTIDYHDGSEPGFCDTILSANLLSIADGNFVDWDLHDLSEANNNIGHNDSEDNLGMSQCTERIYSLFLKNREDSAATMIVGNASTNEWTAFLTAGSTLTLPVDSIFAIIGDQPAGLPVDGADNCNLRIAADGGTLAYGLNYVGASS